MNKNLTASGASHARLKRIKIGSRFLKVMVLLYIGCLVASLPRLYHMTPDGWTMFAGTYATFAEIPWYEKLLAFLCAGIFIGTILTSYQLLGLYERGIIFSARNVRLLQRIGLLVISYGVLTVLGRTLIFAWRHWIGSSSGSASDYLLNALSLDILALLISPWIIGGFFVAMISHIMGEGCKLQEEQELTV